MLDTTPAVHLDIDKSLQGLEGDRSVLDAGPVRRTTYERYRTLPRDAVFIRGQFDPFRWAADVSRRSDAWSADMSAVPASVKLRIIR